MRIDPVAAAGFAAGAEVYERARPSYPDAAVEWLAERVGLRRGRTVVDVGAGTGKLTRLLVPTGARVIAVEPVLEMLAKLVEAVPGIETVRGTAEDLPLQTESADAVTVAQALHWFDHERALPELRRVLRSNGALALVWNMRDTNDPLQAELEALLAPEREAANVPRAGLWRGPVEQSPFFGPLEVERFPFAQQFTVDDLCDRVSSTSFVAAKEPVQRERLLELVRGLVRGVAEPFAFRYVTEVYVAEAR